MHSHHLSHAGSLTSVVRELAELLTVVDAMTSKLRTVLDTVVTLTSAGD